MTLFTDDPTLFVLYSRPSIARAASANGRSLVAVQHTGLLFTGSAIKGLIVNVDGTVLGPVFQISNTSLDVGAPDVDGFDRQWTAAWEASDGEGVTRIQIAPIALDVSTGTATVGATVDAHPPGLFSDASRPAVGLSAGKSWIGWQDTVTFPLSSSLRLKGFDSASCTPCEGPFTLESGSASAAQWVAVATPTSGGAYDDDRGLATWSIVGLSGDVKAQVLKNNHGLGTTQNIGGGCGSGGTVSFSAAPSIGSSWWALTLRSVAFWGTER